MIRFITFLLWNRIRGMSFQDILGIGNILVVIATAVMIFLYTKAAQRSNEIQEQPLLSLFFKEDNRARAGSRTGRLTVKNIGKGPAYNILFESITLKGYRYRFYLEDPVLETMQEESPRAVVKTPDGGTEGFDQNLMWFLARLVPQGLSYEAIEHAKNNPAMFLARYQGTNGKHYYSVFALYCNLPPVGDILMQFVAHGSGNFSIKQAENAWMQAKKINSPFED